MARRLLFAMMALALGGALMSLPSAAKAADDDAGGYSGAAPAPDQSAPDAQDDQAPADDAAPAEGDDSADAPPADDGGEAPPPAEDQPE